MSSPISNTHSVKLRYIDLAYDHEASEDSLLELVYRIQPKWRDTPDQIEIVKFTDGITNTVSALYCLPYRMANTPVSC